MNEDDLIAALEAGFGAGPLPYRLGVAVSGGSDSLALLHLLQETGKFELSVVTVNHGLRPTAASEALHVARICEGLGVPHEIVDWKGWDGRGNLQDQARRNRYALIADWAEEQRLDGVAIGHTRDDLAETFLMRLARASGVDGLSAMPGKFRREGVIFWRPLLAVARAELQVFLTSRGVTWVDDPSNHDEQYERVRVRELRGLMTPFGVTDAAIAQVARNLAEARETLGLLAADWARGHVRVEVGDILIDRTALSALPAELRRRILGAALRFVSSADYPPRRESMADLLDAVAERRNHALSGCYVMVTDMTVRITREAAQVAQTRSATNLLWDGRWRLGGGHGAGLEVRALGDGLSDCRDWRTSGLPRATLLASPAVWRDETLIAAPLAGFGSGWTATAPGLDAFVARLIAH